MPLFGLSHFLTVYTKMTEIEFLQKCLPAEFSIYNPFNKL